MFTQNQSEIAVVGVGSAGSRIVSHLRRQTQLPVKFAAISCDADDLNPGIENVILIESPVDQKLSPSLVRGLASRYLPNIVEVVAGSKVVFVVAGLGGGTGSGLAPVVASVASECGAVTVGVAVMPFEYEKKLKFYAGVSLRHLRAAARGVIVIDNDTLMKSSPEDSTLTGLYEAANKEAAKAFGSLITPSSDSCIPVGLNKVLATVIQDGYAVLSMSTSDSVDKAEEALAGAVVSIGKIAEAKQASHAVVMLTGNASLSAAEVGVAVKRLGSMIDNEEVDIEYGVNYSGSAQLQVSLLASGFKSTKYDDFDPLHSVLKGRVLDSDMDSSLPEGLSLLPPCE